MLQSSDEDQAAGSHYTPFRIAALAPCVFQDLFESSLNNDCSCFGQTGRVVQQQELLLKSDEGLNLNH